MFASGGDGLGSAAPNQAQPPTRASWLIAAALLIGMWWVPLEASAFCRMSVSANQCCNPGGGCTFLAWNRRCIAVGLDVAGSRDIGRSRVEMIIDRAFTAWQSLDCGSGESGFDVRRLEDASQCNIAQYNPDEGNINTIAFISDWTERGNDPQAFALTTVWHSTRTGEIFDADMEINELKGPYGECPVPDGCRDGQTVDLLNVLTHEFGHFYGLGHTTSDVAATMFPMSAPGDVSRRFLKLDDIQGFCAIYPTRQTCDSSNNANFAPVNGLLLECAGDGGCSGCSTTRRNSLAGLWIATLALIAFAGGQQLRRRRS